MNYPDLTRQSMQAAEHCEAMAAREYFATGDAYQTQVWATSARLHADAAAFWTELAGNELRNLGEVGLCAYYSHRATAAAVRASRVAERETYFAPSASDQVGWMLTPGEA